MKHTSIILIACLLLTGATTQAREADDVAEPIKAGDLSAWRMPTGAWHVAGKAAMDEEHPDRLKIEDGTGVLTNGAGGRSSDLITVQEFGDIELRVEFMIPRHSNSGIYLMGRYELQIYDSFGVEKDQYPGIECGGIYPRWIDGKRLDGRSPALNASLPAGQWQTFNVVFQAPRFNAAGVKIANGLFVKVEYNGKVIHENVEVTGPTRGALSNDEKPKGPLRLQGDHGPVAFRNLQIRPLASPATTRPRAD